MRSFVIGHLPVNSRVPLSPCLLEVKARHARTAACRGTSLLEIMVALVLSLGTVLTVGPALGISLAILRQEQRTIDQEIALETAWHEICSNSAQFASTTQKECSVGNNRDISVKIEPLADQSGLKRWKLSFTDSDYTEERWLSR